MIFEKKALVRGRSQFNPKDDIREIVEFIRQQRVPGEVRITLPGNGGITSVMFFEKEHVAEVAKESA